MGIVASDRPTEYVPTERELARDRRRLALLWEIQERKALDPLSFYEPSEKQRKFHESAARFRLILGGNQSGKTTAEEAELAAAALGFYPWKLDGTIHTNAIRPETLPKDKRFLTGDGEPIRVPNLGMILANGNDDGVINVIIPKLMELAAPYIERTVKGAGGPIVAVNWKNGSQTLVRSYGKDADKFAGTTLDYLAVDEPMPEDVWTECRRGLIARCARAWFAMTPLSEPWMYDQLYTPACEGNPDYFAIKITYWDNDKRPHDDPDWVARQTEEEAQSRLYGEFKHLSGRVYKEFDSAVHVIEPFDIPSEWPRWQVIDPHDRRPFFVIWAAVGPDDTLYLYREWPDRPFEKMTSCDVDIDGYCRIFDELEKGETIDFRIMDPKFGVQTRGMTTVKGEFDKRKVWFDCNVVSALEVGHLKVKEYLRFDRTKPVDALNKPKMYIFSTLRNTIWCFDHYIWSEARGGGPAREKVREIGKDGCDAVRYLCVCEPRSHRQVPWNRHAFGVVSYSEVG